MSNGTDAPRIPTVVKAAGRAIAMPIMRSSVNQRPSTVAAVCPANAPRP